MRTADCVVGGFRYATGKPRRSARCCSASTTTTACCTTSASRRASRRRSAPSSSRSSSRSTKPPGFTGRAPGGPSRWSTERIGAVGAARARARRRGPLRPLHRGPLPPRHEVPALAARQGAAPVHDGSGRPEEDARLVRVWVLVTSAVGSSNAGLPGPPDGPNRRLDRTADGRDCPLARTAGFSRPRLVRLTRCNDARPRSTPRLVRYRAG